MALIIRGGRFANAHSSESKAQFKKLAAQATADLSNLVTLGSGMLTGQEQDQLRDAVRVVMRLSEAIQSRKAFGE